MFPEGHDACPCGHSRVCQREGVGEEGEEMRIDQGAIVVLGAPETL